MRKKRILLHAMTFKRDFGFVYCLSKILEKLGCEVYVCSNTDYIGWPMKLWNPDVVFFVTAGRMERIAKKFPDAKLVLWNAESCRMDTDDPLEIQIAANEKDYKNMGRVLLWGQGAKDIILKRAKENKWNWITEDPETFDKKFVIVGHPRLDLSKYGNQDLETGEKIKIGFIGVCSVLNNIKHSTPELLLDAYESERQHPERADRCYFDAKYFDMIAKLMHELGHEKYEYNIRPYFLENLDNYLSAQVVKTGKLQIDDSIEFTSWVKNQNLIIGSVSTTMFLVAAAEKSYINVDTMFGRPPNIFSEKYLSAIPKHCPENHQEFRGMVENYSQVKLTFDSSDILAEQRKNYLSSEGEMPVLYKIAKEVVATTEQVPAQMGLSRSLCHFLNGLRQRYAELRGLKKGPHFDYSHFDRDVVMPKAEKEFSSLIEDLWQDACRKTKDNDE